MSVKHALPHRTQPFIGLRPFSPEERFLFFGREVDCDRIFHLVRCSRIHIIYAPSAFGKSSLLRAGLMPRLKEDNQHDVIYLNSWSENAIEMICKRLMPNWTRRSGNSLSVLAKEKAALASQCPVIILDQAEEIAHAPAELEELWDELAAIANSAVLTARFVVSLREDFLGMLTPLIDRVPGLMDSSYRLERLTIEHAKTAITSTIERFNELSIDRTEPMRIESALVDEVLNQVQSGHISLTTPWSEQSRPYLIANNRSRYVELPFLQLVMNRIWEEETRLGSTILRRSTLSNLGDAQSIVESHLQQVINHLSQSDQVLAAELFRYLITPSGTKLAHTPTDLAHYSKSSRVRVKRLLEMLASGQTRILRPIEPALAHGEPRYEILHEVLAPALQGWAQREAQKQELAEQDKHSIALSMMMVVHDLKAPLQSVTNGLASIGRELSPSEQTHYVKRYNDLKTKVQYLHDKVLEFETISRWASNEEVQYNWVSGSVEELVQRVVRVHQMAAKKKDVSIVILSKPKLPTVKMDSGLLQLAFANVIDNAVKYSFPGREVRINFDKTQTTIAVRIENYGIGLSESEVQNIFQRGFRGSDAFSMTRGMGLGLFLAREIVNRHNGTIEFFMTPGVPRTPHVGYLTSVVVSIPRNTTPKVWS